MGYQKETGVHLRDNLVWNSGGEGHKITSSELLCPDLTEVPVALIFVWTLLHIYGANGFHGNLHNLYRKTNRLDKSVQPTTVP